MYVKKLQLRNFRNYESQDVEFSEKLNVLYGENAQGKTNILEAVFLCSTGRSHRTQKDAEMIRFGENAAVVGLTLERKPYGEFRIEIELQRTGRKSIMINGVPQKRAGDLLGRLNCVIFSPEDLAVIQDEPQVRRRFLDMFISQIKPAYYFNLQRYINILRQRNTLLRQSRDNPRLLDTIAAWDIPLAETGAKVMRERRFFIERTGEYAKINHSAITGGREELAVSYDPSLKEKEKEEDIIKNAFLKTLERSLDADLARMTTWYGPHKDDIAIMLDGKNIRLFGSQGQQRTAALALKMAQVDVMAAETGDIPVLLLDDVMSELDRGRQANLSLNMKNAQTFMTGTERFAYAGAAAGGIMESGDTAYGGYTASEAAAESDTAGGVMTAGEAAAESAGAYVANAAYGDNTAYAANAAVESAVGVYRAAGGRLTKE